ncbi:MAG: DUF2085 domain-containing protein [Acidobacteriota bacterium]|nr:DUF2085 domain-containing protein [Acidobacteriota bacterium]
MSFLYRAAMFVGGLWCHQLPARSPHMWGVQMPLCWRCAGILFGATTLLIWLLATRRLPRLRISFVLALLMPLDVLYAIFSHSDGSNTRRLVTGILWGVFGTSAALRLIEKLRGSQKGEHSIQNTAYRTQNTQFSALLCALCVFTSVSPC